MRDPDSPDRLGRLAELERRYDGPPPAALLRRALHGGRFRLLHAAQSRLSDRLAGATVAAIARRRLPAAPDDSRLAELAADLRFCRKHGLLWKRYARESRSGG